MAALLTATPSSETFTFTYVNRPIVLFKANVLGRSPMERAAGASRALDDLVAQGVTGPIDSQLFEGGALISVGSRVVLALTTADVDNLSGETIQGASALAVARLQIALEEAAEARRLRTLLRSAAIALGGLVIGVALLWVIGRIRRAVAGKLIAAAEKTVARSRIADVEMLHGMRIADLERRMVQAAMVGLDLLVVYWMLTFTLRQFPYTRPWGESLRAFLLTTIANLGLGMLNALPGLFTVALILLITRFVIRVLGLWFHAVESGRVTARWIYPETAQPTRRLVATLGWMFAAVVAYPYLPGSQTEAFKGISVFLGLMVTLGSTGLVNQIMSGFTLTYSRALRVGDFVRIGEVEGTVTHLGVLSTKLRTLRNEDVTVPNAVVVSQTTTDFSRYGDTLGVFIPTFVTIGYDAPWRQVHAMLLAGGGAYGRHPPRTETSRAPGGARGLLREVRAVRVSRAAGPAAICSGRPAREHPGRVQRVRRADHVAELRLRSLRSESRAEEGLVRRACRSPIGRRRPVASAAAPVDAAPKFHSAVIGPVQPRYAPVLSYGR